MTDDGEDGRIEQCAWHWPRYRGWPDRQREPGSTLMPKSASGLLKFSQGNSAPFDVHTDHGLITGKRRLGGDLDGFGVGQGRLHRTNQGRPVAKASNEHKENVFWGMLFPPWVRQSATIINDEAARTPRQAWAGRNFISNGILEKRCHSFLCRKKGSRE